MVVVERNEGEEAGDNGDGALDCDLSPLRQAPAASPGPFGRIPPIQSRAADFRPLPVSTLDRPRRPPQRRLSIVE